jgi:hypothetical protein
MAAAGAEYVLKEFTWTHRLEEVMRAISSLAKQSSAA